MALIGLETIQRFVVHFDSDKRVLTLRPPETFSHHGSDAVTPFPFQDNQPEIKRAVDGIAGLFTVDTGDSGSLLLLAPFALRHRLVERYHADLPYSGNAVTTTRGVCLHVRSGIWRNQALIYNPRNTCHVRTGAEHYVPTI